LHGDLVLLVGQRDVHLLLATGEGQWLRAHGGAVPAAQVFLGVLGQGAQHGANGPGGVRQRLHRQARVSGELVTDKGGGGLAGGERRVLEDIGEEGTV